MPRDEREDREELEYVKLGALWLAEKRPDGTKPRYRSSGVTDRDLGGGDGLHIPAGAKLFIWPFERQDGSRRDRDPAYTISVGLPKQRRRPQRDFEEECGDGRRGGGGRRSEAPAAAQRFDDDTDDPFAEEE